VLAKANGYQRDTYPLSLSLSLSLCVCVCVCACLLVFISEHCLSIFIRGIFAVMETIKNLFTPQAATQLKKGADTPGRPLQDQFEDQTARLREIHKAQRPKNTTKAYEPKQKEWED
jgi:hypothetical protein